MPLGSAPSRRHKPGSRIFHRYKIHLMIERYKVRRFVITHQNLLTMVMRSKVPFVAPLLALYSL